MFKKTSSSVVKDPRVLDFSYIPGNLPHREKQMDRMSALFSPVLDSPVSQNVFFLGPVGTGKTSLAHRFCLDFIQAGKGTKAIKYKMVNCRNKRSNMKAIHEIVRTFQPLLSRGYSITDMLEIFRKDLEKRKLHFIVVLDEADVLVRNDGSELIYHLTRFDEERAGASGSVSLIMISTKNMLDTLDAATMSTFKRSNIVKFGKYSQAELLDIIGQRTKLGLHPGTIRSKGKEFIAKIAAEQGDARRAIELLQVSAGYADEEKKRNINIEHIRKAKSQVAKEDVEPHINSLDEQRKLALLGIARGLRKKSSITMGEAEANYSVACEEIETKARAHTMFWKYVNELASMGIVDTEPSGRGRQGSTTIISLQELPAEVLIEVLEKELLGD